MENREPLAHILLDVDGVLNPDFFEAENCPDWVFEPKFKSSKASGRYTLALSREMGKAIEDLNCQVHWLTTWGTHAHFNIGIHFDWNNHPILAEKPPPIIEPDGMYGRREVEDHFWKPRAVKKFLLEPGPKVIWIDDDIEAFQERIAQNGMTLDPHNRLLTICPDELVGLTKQHLNLIREFIQG
jgi:hypothetical protein